MNDAWIIFRGKLVSNPEVESPIDIGNMEEVVEVVKAEKISKSYLKLKENPLFHPNVSYGDIMKVKQCDKSLSDKVTILEFNGVEYSDVSEEVKDLGSENVGLSQNLVSMMKNLDSQARPLVNDKFEQGLVFEPVAMVSHGSYKINISYEAGVEELNKMKEHFKKWDVYFQPSAATNLGSVAFGLDKKFKEAVECLESSPYIKGCYLAFDPEEFPMIEFSPDLIPKNED